MATSDVKIVKYTGEYGPNLDGLLKTEFPGPLEHNFHIRQEVKASVASEWGFADRPWYRLLELELSLVNLGDGPMDLGNMFAHPQYYQIVTGGAQWQKITRNVFSYSFDNAPPTELKTIMLWDFIPAAPGLPKLPSSFLSTRLSPGWGASVAEPMYAPIDITTLVDGPHTFSLTVSPPNMTPHTVNFNFTIDVTDLRITQ